RLRISAAPLARGAAGPLAVIGGGEFIATTRPFLAGVAKTLIRAKVANLAAGGVRARSLGWRTRAVVELALAVAAEVTGRAAGAGAAELVDLATMGGRPLAAGWAEW